jgi:hypothetical protein
VVVGDAGGGAPPVDASDASHQTDARADGSGDEHLDPLGDAPTPGADLLEAHVWLDEEQLVVRLTFAGDPLAGAEVPLVAVEMPHDGRFRREYLEVERRGAGYSVRLVSRSIGFDPCAVASVDASEGLLEVHLPASVFSDVELDRFSVTVSHDADVLDAGEVRIEAGPPPPAPSAPACQRWDDGSLRVSTVPFSDLALGYQAACGLTPNGEVLCWGAPDDLATLGSPPAGPFEEIGIAPSFGNPFACARRSSGAIECWGDGAPVLSGLYDALGDTVGCVLTQAGDLHCVENGPFPALDMQGPFTEVGGLAQTACGLTAAGFIVCSVATSIPSGSFSSLVVASDDGPCGLRSDGTFICGSSEPVPYELREADGHQQGFGNVGPICGLTLDGSPVCFGAGGVTPLVAPGPFEHLYVATTGTTICGLRADDRLVCWGNPHSIGFTEQPGAVWVP